MRLLSPCLLFVDPLQPLLRNLSEHIVVEVLESDYSIVIAVKLHYLCDPSIQLFSEPLLCHQWMFYFNQFRLEYLSDAVLSDDSSLYLADIEFLEFCYNIELTCLV